MEQAERIPLQAATVALAADDERITRVLGGYLLDRKAVARCEVFRRGRDLLYALSCGADYPILILDEQLFDQTAEEFVQQLVQQGLPQLPGVFILARGRYLELSERLRCYDFVRCLGRINDPARLYHALSVWYDSAAARLADRCEPLYRSWGVQERRRDCAYLTDAVRVVLTSGEAHLLRKQVFADAGLRRGVELSAVESGIQRMIHVLAAEPTQEYQNFLARYGLQPQRVTPIRLVNALAAELGAAHQTTEQGDTANGKRTRTKPAARSGQTAGV